MAQIPHMYIPYTTMCDWIGNGCDGTKKLAPKLGRPTKIPYEYECEIAKQVYVNNSAY